LTYPVEHPPLDDALIMEVLARHRVDYVLVGGVAARLHGATRPTKDFDLCPCYTRDNLSRLVAALQELGSIYRGNWDELPPLSVDSLWRMEVALWRSEAGDIDVLLGIPAVFGLMTYEDLFRRATPHEFGCYTVHVACLADIIASKRNANRDYSDGLPELDALLAARSKAARRGR
jgi:hypothetical protein